MRLLWPILAITTVVHGALLWSVRDMTFFPSSESTPFETSGRTFATDTVSAVATPQNVEPSYTVSTLLVPSPDTAPSTEAPSPIMAALPSELPVIPGAGATLRPTNGTTTAVSLFQLQTNAQRVVYLIDASGSMYKECGSQTRVDLARQEVARSIAALKPDTEFNIIFFANQTVAFSPKTVYATAPMKAAAAAFLAQVPDLNGETNLTEGIAQALHEKPDSLFLLTDGGTDVPMWQILNLTRQLEQQSQAKTRIYTVGFDVVHEDSDNEPMLRKLAAQNGGAYLPCAIR